MKCHLLIGYFQRLLYKFVPGRNEGQQIILKQSALDRSRGSGPPWTEGEAGARVRFQAHGHISDKAGRKCSA